MYMNIILSFFHDIAKILIPIITGRTQNHNYIIILYVVHVHVHVIIKIWINLVTLFIIYTEISTQDYS